MKSNCLTSYIVFCCICSVYGLRSSVSSHSLFSSRSPTSLLSGIPRIAAAGASRGTRVCFRLLWNASLCIDRQPGNACHRPTLTSHATACDGNAPAFASNDGAAPSNDGVAGCRSVPWRRPVGCIDHDLPRTRPDIPTRQFMSVAFPSPTL